MNATEIFNRLFGGGKFTLPYLLKFSHPDLQSLYFVNGLSDIDYNGETYIHSSFDYSEPKADGTGASLSITIIDNSLIQFLEYADEEMKIEAVGVINQDGTISPIKIFKHLHCVVTYDSEMKASFTLNKDDRAEMSFPPYVFDSDNNRGGA